MGPFMLGLFTLNVFNSSNKTGVDSLLNIISIYTRLNAYWTCTCHAQRAHRRNNVIFLMDFQDEYESDGMDTTEALLFFLHECFMVI